MYYKNSVPDRKIVKNCLTNLGLFLMMLLLTTIYIS